MKNKVRKSSSRLVAAWESAHLHHRGLCDRNLCDRDLCDRDLPYRHPVDDFFFPVGPNAWLAMGLPAR